jgi:vacuolar-type H+-ATPase subunit B/Vma2
MKTDVTVIRFKGGRIEITARGSAAMNLFRSMDGKGMPIDGGKAKGQVTQ